MYGEVVLVVIAAVGPCTRALDVVLLGRGISDATKVGCWEKLLLALAY